MLVRAGPEGVPAGDIARATGSIANTIDPLSILGNAGLIASRLSGRSIIYHAAYDHIGDLLTFLVEDCCGGNPEICAAVLPGPSRGCR